MYPLLSLLHLRRVVVKSHLRSENSNIGLIWPSLVPFTPSHAWKMRPRWTRLVLRSLVSGVPGVDSFGPPVASLLDVRGAGDRDGTRFPVCTERRRRGQAGQTLNSVAFGCISLLSHPPNPHPPPSPRGRGDLQGCEVPAFAGTTSAIRQNDVCEQCSNRRSYSAMGCCRCSEGGAWSDGCRLGSAVSHVSEFVHCVVNGAG